MKICRPRPVFSLFSFVLIALSAFAGAQGPSSSARLSAVLPIPATGGVFFGLLHGDSFATSGYVRAVITRGGRGSVAVVLGAEKPCVVVVGVDPGSFVLTPIAGGDADMQVELKLVVQPDGTTALTGRVTDDGHEIAVEASKRVSRAASATHAVGRFTFVLGTAAGDADIGCGAVRIGAGGAVRGAVRLTDGRARMVLGSLSEAGDWPLYVTAHTGLALSGAVAVAGTGALSGTLHLRTPATATEATLNLTGGPYLPEAGFLARKTRQVYSAAVQATPAEAPAFAQAGRLNFADALVPLDAGSRGLALALQRESGWIVGQAKAADGTVYQARGVVLSRPNQVRGFFRQPNTGTFAIIGVAASTGGSVTTVGSLVKTGAGTLTLTGSPIFTGGAGVNGGSLTGGVIVTGSGSQLIPSSPFNGGTLVLGGATAGGLVTTGAGALTLTGTNTFTGAFEIGPLGLTSGAAMTTWAENDPEAALGWASNVSGVNGSIVSGSPAALVFGGSSLVNFGVQGIAGSTIIVRTPATTNVLGLTDELENPVTFELLHDGDYVLLGGRRYQVSRATSDSPMILSLSPPVPVAP